MMKSSSKPPFRSLNHFILEQELTTSYLWENSATFDQIIHLQKSEYTHQVPRKNNTCSCNPTLYQNGGKLNCPGNQKILGIYSQNLSKTFWHCELQICQNLNLQEHTDFFILLVKK